MAGRQRVGGAHKRNRVYTAKARARTPANALNAVIMSGRDDKTPQVRAHFKVSGSGPRSSNITSFMLGDWDQHSGPDSSLSKKGRRVRFVPRAAPEHRPDRP